MADSRCWRAAKKQSMLTGTVTVMNKDICHIKSDDSLPNGYTGKDVYFTNHNLHGLQFGTKVKFILSEISKGRPQALRVYLIGPDTDSVKNVKQVNKQITVPPVYPTTPKSSTHFGSKQPPLAKLKLQGVVINISDAGIGCVQVHGDLPEELKGYHKTFSFHTKWVEPSFITPCIGDVLEFEVNKKGINELPASFFRLISCSVKTDLQIYMLLQNLKSEINCKSAHYNGILLQVLRCNAIWKCLGSSPFLSDVTIVHLLDLLEGICEQSKISTQSFQQAIQVLFNSNLCSSPKCTLRKFISEAWETKNIHHQEKIKKFLIMVIDNLPNKAKVVSNLIKEILPPCSETIEFFLHTVIQKLSKCTAEDIGDFEWDELPLVPSAAELLEGSITARENLSSVKTCGPYKSAYDYVDTYFRLLREDCFSSLKSGIQGYLANTLNPRDLNVYRHISLESVNVAAKRTGLMLGLQVTPHKEIDDWETCKNLNPGNLVCLSPSGSFTDMIWATVAEKDPELLEAEGIILVDLMSDSNTYDDVECTRILKDASPRTVMVESPSYYMAYWPVLKALQMTEPEKLSFQDELVLMKSPQVPETLGMIHLDASSEMDTSQRKAFVNALSQRIGIIQGPPGTGKTFIGIQLVKHFLKFGLEQNRPVVILTYKNHVLDEFTKAVLEFLPNDVVRVGGGWKDEALEHCNLYALKKKRPMPKEIASERHAVQHELFAVKSTLHALFRQFNSAVNFSAGSIFQMFTPTQIEALLTGSNLKNPTEEGWESVEESTIKDAVKNYQSSMTDQKTEDRHHPKPQVDIKLVSLITQALKQWLPLKTFEDILKVEEGLNSTTLLKPTCLFETEADKLEDTYSIEETGIAEEVSERFASCNSQGTCRRLDDEIKLEDRKRAWNVPFLPSIAQKWANQTSVKHLSQVCDPWKLRDYDRALVVQVILWRQREKIEAELKQAMHRYKELLAVLKEIDVQNDVSVLQNKRVIAMTLTGASIRHKVLQLLKPAVVIVEEAAEVLEPHIMAVLGHWVKHLILIGDHMQLKPRVDSHTLAKDYHLDVSMMERLINNGYPFSTLQLQNRMLPEMAELLLDIYPNLQTNYSSVARNLPPTFIPSMYFWTHEDSEYGERSYANFGEAERVVKLAQLFFEQGYQPEQVTILAAYKGQVDLLQQMLMEAGNKEEDTPECTVKVYTIDMFQGDENDIIIISLVRSNNTGQIGFLNTINRRCVAQSRARCGMYLVGNRLVLQQARNSCWTNLIHKLEAKGLIGPNIPLHCKNHREASSVEAETADKLPVLGPCKLPCPITMGCGKHKCEKTCQPFHEHKKCEQTVKLFIVDVVTMHKGHAGNQWQLLYVLNHVVVQCGVVSIHVPIHANHLIPTRAHCAEFLCHLPFQVVATQLQKSVVNGRTTLYAESLADS